MNLWIRSQNKQSLLKPVSISLDNLKSSIFGYYNDDHYEVLGKYKTEERALEVLDEIQDFISTKIREGKFGYEEVDLILKSQIVNNMSKIYEMPKE